MYHKIDVITPSKWWVSVGAFERQVSELISQNRVFVHLDNYEAENAQHVVLTFDDAYENIFHHAFPLLEKHAIPFEVFVNGDLIGRWNDFDRGEMKTRFASLEHLEAMTKGGARLQWHGRTHAWLPQLNDRELEVEMTVDTQLTATFPAPHFRWFAYPSGMHDERALAFARANFKGALSVDLGSSSDTHLLNRVTVEEHSVFTG